MPAPRHPKDALFAGEKPFPVIPACEHFAGSEKLITKALDLQEQARRRCSTSPATARTAPRPAARSSTPR